MSTPYTLLRQDDPDSLPTAAGSTEPQSIPDPPHKYKWIFPRGCHRILKLAVVAFVLLAVGFGIGFFLPCPHCSTVESYNYNTFYGIPANLTVIPSDGLVNHTELDLKTGFKMSRVPRKREYTFNVTQALAAPDGFQKPMILINNHFPGPLIEANSGDTIIVHVNNLMLNWSTAIHWHGINQRKTAWMDGVAGISQCGIPPGQNFTYEFILTDQRGTFWYHSHLSVQYTDGLFGPIVVHDPTERIPEVYEERIVFMGDWYHTYASILVSSFLNPTPTWLPTHSGIEPLADNLLINGRNNYNCSVVSTTFPPGYGGQPPPVCNASEGGLYVTKVKSGRDYRLRLINHSSFFSFWFSVDNHTLAIVEMDGVEIEPIPFRGVYVNIGQRYSVIIRTNQTVGNYYMRATLPTTCFLPFVQYNSSGLNSTNFHAMGVLSYDDTDPGAPPIGVAGNTSNPYGASDNPHKDLVWEGCNDMPFNMPVPTRPEPSYDVKWEYTTYIEYAFRQSQNVDRVFINSTSWAPLEHNATLWKTIGQNISNLIYDDDQLVLNISEKGTGMAAQVVINGLSTMEHPWHLHGHDFQVVGWGNGTFKAETTTWNHKNPMRRDTVTVPAKYFLVLRFLSDNPGVWAFHCHVAWHMEGGMLVQFLEQPEELQKLLSKLPSDFMDKSLSFCPESGDQAFGTEAEWKPADLGPAAAVRSRKTQEDRGGIGKRWS